MYKKAVVTVFPMMRYLGKSFIFTMKWTLKLANPSTVQS